MVAASERTRQLEQMLGHIAHNQVGGDRRHLVQAGFAELALDVVFVGETEAAVGLQAGVGRLPAGLGRQVLGHVGRRPGVAPGVVFLAGAPAHQVGSLDLDMRLGDGELHALVLPDGPAEHNAIAGVLRGLLDKPATVADALRRDQRALGIQAVEDVAETLTLLADQTAGGNLQVVEEQLVGLVVDHVGDRLHGKALSLIHISEPTRPY